MNPRGATILAAIAALSMNLPWAAAQKTDDKPAYPLVPHSDSQYAHELFRLKQMDILKSQQVVSVGTPAENLWKSELLLAQFDDLTKDKSKSAQVTDDYLASLTAYFKSQNKGVDGAWALDHAQFILSKLAQPIVTRMEYWAGNRRDREALAPLAALADDLLRQASTSLDASMKLIESSKQFDERAYTRGYSAAAEVKYYTAWAAYFKAMALDPAESALALDRRKLLAQAADALNEWAVDDADNGVNFQAYLLRGKILSESADLPRAIADFTKAQSDKAPNWVQYQGRYQIVVAHLRTGDFKQAQAALDAFKRWIPKDNAEAQLSADMLGYRVAWALADARSDSAERRSAHRDALGILAAIIDRDPRFRTLVYEQLAAQIPENTDLKDLLPMQQLAFAWNNSQRQKGDTPESQKQLQTAVEAALIVKNNSSVSRADKVEATFLAGACNALLNNLPEAVKYNIEFAEMAPKDPRARQMIDLALQQIGELRKNAAQANGTLSPELRDLANKALSLATSTFGDKQWLYAQARMLEESGKSTEAAATYANVAPDDRNYLDARYRLVTLATERFSRLPANSTKAQQVRAANELFAACTSFITLLDHPPTAAPKEVLEAAKAYRYNIWLIEAATALNPAVKNLDVAIDRLNKLDQASAQLNDAQRTTVLRYRVQAYQLAGQPEKAMQVVSEYANAQAAAGVAGGGRGGSGDAMNVIRGMVLSTVDEIDKTEPTDPTQAKMLAANVVQLLNFMIQQAAKDGKKEEAFEYHIIQADMMVRAGQYKEAQELCATLVDDKKPDIRVNMIEARAIFADAQTKNDLKEFARAQESFRLVLEKLTPGTESYWECWLRLLQSIEAQGGADTPGEIKKRLGDLKGVFGDKFGGDRFKDDFTHLASKYNVQ